MSSPAPETLASLKEFMNRITPIREEAWAWLSQSMVHRRYPKGSFFVQQGEVAGHIGFAIKGLFRFYYLVDGHEHVRQFFFENNFFGDFQSYLTQQPSQLFIEAMEESEALLIPYADMQEGYRLFPEFERMSRILNEQLLIFFSRRLASLLMDTPEKRYQDLVKSRPKVMERVPQYMISSYLGVTPEALSRIRRRLAERE